MNLLCHFIQFLWNVVKNFEYVSEAGYLRRLCGRNERIRLANFNRKDIIYYPMRDISLKICNFNRKNYFENENFGTHQSILEQKGQLYSGLGKGPGCRALAVLKLRGRLKKIKF